ncbi:MAG: ABC transporter substrate-binding protein [Parvularculaceae bacterium]
MQSCPPIRWALLVLSAFALAIGVAQAENGHPQALSLDVCADQYLLGLADPDQILAVSRSAASEYSYLRAKAEPYPRIRATTEEALARRPDVVIRQWGGGATTGAALERFGARVVNLGFASDFDGVRENIRLVAAALGQAARGEALIQEMDARLAALSSIYRPKPFALYVTPGGVTAGSGTMIDAIMTAANVINAAGDETGWPPLPAETLILNPPQLVVAGFFNTAEAGVDHWSLASHPALAALFSDTPTVRLPPDLIGCAGWFSVDAAERIADAIANDSETGATDAP